MNKILVRSVIAILLALTLTNIDKPQNNPNSEVLASKTINTSISATPVPTVSPEETKKNKRVAALQKYLAKKNSPMQNNAEHFITTSQKYDLDWKLLPAIAGVESGFGKAVPHNSYNPFGWGGGKIHFESWSDAVDTVGNKLSKNYIQKGLTTPQQMQRIYAPPSTTWANKVSYFMQQIENTYQYTVL